MLVLARQIGKATTQVVGCVSQVLKMLWMLLILKLWHCLIREADLAIKGWLPVYLCQEWLHQVLRGTWLVCRLLCQHATQVQDRLTVESNWVASWPMHVFVDRVCISWSCISKVSLRSRLEIRVWMPVFRVFWHGMDSLDNAVFLDVRLLVLFVGLLCLLKISEVSAHVLYLLLVLQDSVCELLARKRRTFLVTSLTSFVMDRVNGVICAFCGSTAWSTVCFFTIVFALLTALVLLVDLIKLCG